MSGDKILRLVKQIIHEGWQGRPQAGRMTDVAFRDLQALNSGYQTPELHLTTHGVTSRFGNPMDEWSEERIADAIEELLNSGATRGMPNFQGGSRRATEALIVAKTPAPLFAPVFPTKDGSTGLATIFEANPARVLQEIEKMASAGGAVVPSSTVLHQLQNGIPGDAVTQPNLSAVNALPSLQDIVERLKGGVKTVAPVATAGGLLGMLGEPEEAAASVPETASEQAPWSQWEWMPEPRRPVTPWDGPPEPGLEKPWFDPIDLLIAPIGAVTMAGKLGAVGLEALFGLAAELAQHPDIYQPHDLHIQ